METHAESSPPEAPDRFRRPKRKYLLAILAVSALDGFTARYVPEEWYLPSVVFFSVLTVVPMIRWMQLDADEHNVELPRRFVPMMVICPGPILMLPIHFFRSRGWSRGLLACLKTLLFFGMNCIVQYLTSSVSNLLP